MEQKLRLKPTNGVLLPKPSRYTRLTSRLIYLTITRPDIVYTINIMSQFMHEPRSSHMDVALRLLRYLKGSPGKGVLLSSSCNLYIHGCCYSHWASCPTTYQFIAIYCTMLGSNPISWKTNKQFVVSRSSAEAEY